MTRRLADLLDDDIDSSAGLNRWMVSYADLITVLFVVFLAVYVLMPKIVAEKAPKAADTTAAVSTTIPRAELTSSLESAMEHFLDSGSMSVTQREDGVALEIRDAALFQPGTAEVTPEAHVLLEYLGKVLALYPNEIRAEGHTDNRAIQNMQYPSNWELSAARASRVVRVLEEHGVAADRLSAVGLGEARPLAANDTESGRALNRRVTILVLH